MCLCSNKVFAMHGKTTLVAIITMSFFGFGSKVKALEVGAPAPAPVSVDQDGKPFAFADVYAKGITLVYFYPKADTPGCTAQACSLRDSFETLKAENLQIMGVSRDTPASQKKFQQKYNLPFSLVADADGKVAEAFGVGGVMGLPVSKRQSFLIKDGRVVWLSPSAKTGEHATEVQAALDSLK
jgi:peroxiredoxin Q/BCP